MNCLAGTEIRCDVDPTSGDPRDDIVMVGHYHQQKIIRQDNGILIFLGDWLTKFSVTTLNEKEIWQGNWEEFIKKLA